MTAPSQTPEAAGLSETYRFSYESIRNGAPGLSDATCAAIAWSINMKVSLAANVTAASAQARIAELESALAAAQNADAENDAHLRSRATAAEARADRLAKGIVQAETLIDDAIKGIQTAPLSVVTDTIWTADPCPMTVVEALQLARAALQQETQP